MTSRSNPKRYIECTLCSRLVKQSNQKDLGYDDAHDLAKHKAKELTADPMLLAWYCGKTGEYYPKTECGRSEKPD